MMEENKVITMINIDRLHPHPDNPRREVGDVSELADSIRVNGIMQNLTVIPRTEDFEMPADPDWEEEYTVLIGHRRLAAAKAAGIYRLPCVIVEGISRAQQILIMNGENSQRHDLTKFEEGASYQLLLDLGETPDSIAKSVGISTATVKRRLELAKHDKDTIENLNYQITIELQDAMRKVKDPAAVDEILRDAKSTENAIIRCDERAKKDKELELMEEARKILKEKGFHEMGYTAYANRRWVDIDTVRSIDIDENMRSELDTVRFQPTMMFVYEPPAWGSGRIRLIRPKDSRKKTEEEKEAEARTKKFKEDKKKLEESRKEMTKAFQSYAGHIVERWTKPRCKESDLITRLWEALLRCGARISTSGVRALLKRTTERLKDYTDDDVRDMPMMYSMLMCLVDNGWMDVADYGGYFQKEYADRYKEMYEILKEFDFEMPDPEWLKLLDGTHEAFRVREEEQKDKQDESEG